MTKFLAGLTTTAVLAGALALVGCESSNKGTNLEPGDPESQEYQEFSEVAEGLSDVTGDMINGVFEQCGLILEQGSVSVSKERSPFSARFAAVETDSFVATYNDVTHYWQTYWSYTDTEKGVTAVFRDSIQFREGMNAVQWPDTATITEIRSGQSASIAFTGEEGSLTITATSNWVIAGEPGAIPGGGEITINGEVSHQVEGSNLTSGCNTELNMAASVDEIKSSLPQLQASVTCPISGSITLQGTASSVCETEGSTGSFDGSWYWRASYNEGNVTIEANNGEFEWNYEGPCEGEGGDEPPPVN